MRSECVETTPKVVSEGRGSVVAIAKLVSTPLCYDKRAISQRRQHMGKDRYDSHPALIRLAAFVTGLSYASSAIAKALPVSLATMPRVATIDQRYQSYNVEMAEVIGGNFWKPYGLQGKPAQ